MCPLDIGFSTPPKITLLKRNLLFQHIKWVCTHYSSGSSSHHAVQDERGDEAGLLCAGVRLHQLRVITEETLHVHAEQVRALHVVGQQHRAGHDDKLEEKHVGARQSQRVEKVEK